MNERIRLLCSQAISDVDGIQNPDTQDMYIPDCFVKMFAELIVRECAEVVTDAVDQREPASTYADKIKQHFGVEE